MRGFFNIDSPFMAGLTKLADMMIVNLLTVLMFLPTIIIAFGVLATGDFFWFILCIPTSIPCGAALTALNFVVLKVVRDEETYIVKTFFKSFKENFKQATALWYIKVAVFAVLAIDFEIVFKDREGFPDWLPLLLIVVSVLVYLLGIHIFPLQSKFENTVAKTIKNSLLVGLMTLPKTVLMVLITAIPFIIYFWFSAAVPILLLFGFSGPAWLCALLYNKTFKKFEPKSEDIGDDWTISEEDKFEVIETNPIEDNDKASSDESTETVLETEVFEADEAGESADN